MNLPAGTDQWMMKKKFVKFSDNFSLSPYVGYIWSSYYTVLSLSCCVVLVDLLCLLAGFCISLEVTQVLCSCKTFPSRKTFLLI
jgi:hypothetical protein